MKLKIGESLLWLGCLCLVVALLFFIGNVVELEAVQDYITETKDYSRVSEMMDKNGDMLESLIWVFISSIPIKLSFLFD